MTARSAKDEALVARFRSLTDAGGTTHLRGGDLFDGRDELQFRAAIEAARVAGDDELLAALQCSYRDSRVQERPVAAMTLLET